MKKITIMALLGIIAMVFCVTSVSAAMTVTDTFDNANPTFGDENQMASNPNADEEEYENIYVDGDITLNNDGSSDVTILSVGVSPATGFSVSDLDITLDDADLTIAAGTSEPVTLNARIPEDLDAVDSDLQESAIKVGTITFNFDDSTSVTFDAYMQRKNMLIVDKLEVAVDGSSDDYDDEDSIGDEARPGDLIEVEVDIENKYD